MKRLVLSEHPEDLLMIYIFSPLLVNIKSAWLKKPCIVNVVGYRVNIINSIQDEKVKFTFSKYVLLLCIQDWSMAKHWEITNPSHVHNIPLSPNRPRSIYNPFIWWNFHFIETFTYSVRVTQRNIHMNNLENDQPTFFFEKVSMHIESPFEKLYKCHNMHSIQS